MTGPDLDDEIHRLLDFAERSACAAGFGSLDARGHLPPAEPLELYVTCRMTHVMGLAQLMEDRPSSAGLLDHGVVSLLEGWQDGEHGGWFASLDPHGEPVEDGKDGYAHAFVVLAGATAVAAGHPRGGELLEAGLAVLRERFWDEEHGMVVDAWDRAFRVCDPYRGLNANMHAVEALLAAHDVTGDEWALEAATRISARVVGELGPRFGWRLPEHFDSAWLPRPDYNIEVASDPFRPYGATIGHLLEWARLLLHLGLALERAGRPDPALAEAADSLTRTAVRDGWAVDGHDGFVYTVDFDGRPVVRERMHWVIAEAIANATLREALDLDEQAAGQARAWLDFAWLHHRDPDGGSWWHELDASLRPSATVWPGKPDVYHAIQALWLRRLVDVPGGCVSFAGAARQVGRNRR